MRRFELKTSEEKKILFECSNELMKKLRCPWEMMPILYALSKYANGNIDEVLQKIDEGEDGNIWGTDWRFFIVYF